jgi:hypothetical protein
MAIYTVHEPPRAREAAPDAERFVFVRDGFYFWAFVFAPLWMLWRRLWLVLLFYVVGVSVLQVGLWLTGASALVQSAAGLLISVLVGFEAASLRRWTLNRRSWENLGVVSGDNREAAERRFFDVWLARKEIAPARISPAPPPLRMSRPSSDIVGLFPEPESRR